MITTINIPSDLVEELDKFIPKKYTTRNHFINEAIREKIARENK